MPWDAFQRDVLNALGHTLLVPVTTPARAAGEAMDPRAAGSGDRSPPALLGALARAAGVDAAQLAELPPLDALRTPVAKRALWPRLRALRQQARR